MSLSAFRDLQHRGIVRKLFSMEKQIYLPAISAYCFHSFIHLFNIFIEYLLCAKKELVLDDGETLARKSESCPLVNLLSSSNHGVPGMINPASLPHGRTSALSDSYVISHFRFFT